MGANKVQEVSIFNMKLRPKTQGHELKLAGRKFKTNLRNYQILLYQKSLDFQQK